MVSRSSDVFKICGSMQFMSGLSLLIGLLSFPAGWDNDEVRGVCGPKADDYKLGSCGVRWAFALAVIALFDTIILGFLAFTLATKKLKVMLEEPAYMNPSMYHGEINPGFMGDNLSIAGSRKSGGLQPVMLMPHGPVPDERWARWSLCNVGLTRLFQILRVLPSHRPEQVALQSTTSSTQLPTLELRGLGNDQLISLIFL